MNKPDIIIGCSSYYNSQWKGLFYPEDVPTSKWFEYYCRHFNTYELNSTFYKFPTVKSLHTWYKKTPEGFLFSAKAPKHITHLKKFVDCEQELNDFYSTCREGLADKLSCILFQLPPSFSYTQERLELVLKSMNPDYNNVIEFRNESWWKQEVYDALANNNITFCSVNYPKLPTAVIATNSIGYVRFHGNPRLFYSQYTPEELEHTVQDILANQQLKEVYIYFNNTASTAAILNAQQLKQLVVL
jgi:uncharacterized protein YecE (DUF72 family)